LRPFPQRFCFFAFAGVEGFAPIHFADQLEAVTVPEYSKGVSVSVAKAMVRRMKRWFYFSDE
jgi:hypothetical protein